MDVTPRKHQLEFGGESESGVLGLLLVFKAQRLNADEARNQRESPFFKSCIRYTYYWLLFGPIVGSGVNLMLAVVDTSTLAVMSWRLVYRNGQLR